MVGRSISNHLVLTVIIIAEELEIAVDLTVKAYDDSMFTNLPPAQSILSVM